MAGKPPFMKTYIQLFTFLAIGGSIGWYLERQEDLRMTRYRDKSALFGRELKPGEAPSWP